MSKENSVSGSFFQELFHVGLYKRTQGRITRQVTCAALIIAFALAAWRLQVLMDASLPEFGWVRTLGMQSLGDQLESTYARLQPTLEYLVPALVLFVGVWASYRIVNLPRFADFLIAVEAEMNKVSWPSKAELTRSSLVVIFVIFALAIILFGYDLFWQLLFEWMGIRR